MAATDLLTDAEARQILGVGAGDTAKSESLTRAITAVSNRLATACGTIIQGTVTAELHDGGYPYVYLNSAPVVSITAVVEYDSTTAGTLTAESNASQPAGGWQINLANGKLYRRNAGADVVFPAGRQNISVTYVAGRCASTATVPEIFKEGAGVMLKNWWRMYESGAGRSGEFDVPQASFPTFAVPKAVKELLAGEWRTGSGVGD